MKKKKVLVLLFILALSLTDISVSANDLSNNLKLSLEDSVSENIESEDYVSENKDLEYNVEQEFEVKESSMENRDEASTENILNNEVDTEKEDIVLFEASEEHEMLQEASTGSAGTNAKWIFSDTTLTISGTGAWTNLSNLSNTSKKKVKKIIVKSGITSIQTAFNEDEIGVEELDVAGTVKRIGDFSFDCTPLKKVTLREGIKVIGRQAFSNTNISTIKIPASVTTIGMWAIEPTNSITVSSDNSYYASKNGILFDKNFKTLIYYPPQKKGTSYTVPKTVTKIMEFAFDSKELNQIVLPEGLEIIEDGAFADCKNLISINLPTTVSYIGREAFPSGVLKRVGDFEVLNNAIIYYVGNGGSVTIPNSIQTIARGAFPYDGTETGSEKITSLKIPKSVLKIDSMLFVKNSIIVDERNTNFVVKDGILYSKDYTILIKCPDNKTGSITIPSEVKTVKSLAFYNCHNLVVTFLSKAPTFEDASFVDSNVTIRCHYNKDGWENLEFDYAKLKNLDNTISCKISSKTVSGSKRTVDLGFSSKVKTKLSFKSSNSKLTINSKGIVTIPAGFIGKTTITVTADETSSYAKTTRKFVFKVVPGKLSFSSVTAGNTGSLVAKWKKMSYISGYELRYSKEEDFVYDNPYGNTSHVREKAVKLKNTITSATITGLSAKTQYRLRIRAYKTVESSTYYGAWSSVKKTTN